MASIDQRIARIPIGVDEEIEFDTDRLRSMSDLAYPGVCLRVDKWRAFIREAKISKLIDDAVASAIDLDDASISPALVVYYLDKSGKLRFAVVDGNHKLRKAEMLGRPSFPCLRFDYSIARHAIPGVPVEEIGTPWHLSRPPVAALEDVKGEKPVARVVFESIARTPTLFGSKIDAFGTDGTRLAEYSGTLDGPLTARLLSGCSLRTVWIPTKPTGCPGVAIPVFQPAPKNPRFPVDGMG